MRAGFLDFISDAADRSSAPLVPIVGIAVLDGRTEAVRLVEVGRMAG
jgi:hypothetical protein